MTFVPISFNRNEQIAIWMKTRLLTPIEWIQFGFQYKTMFVLVSLYLIGHLLMWIGFSSFMMRKTSLLGVLVLIVGCLSTFLDFSEYGLRGTMLKAIEWNMVIPPSLILFWYFIREMSIWMIYIASVIAAVGVLHQNFFGELIGGVSLVGILTIPLFYGMGYGKVWFIWLILWHVVAALFLWKKALEMKYMNQLALTCFEK